MLVKVLVVLRLEPGRASDLALGRHHVAEVTRGQHHVVEGGAVAVDDLAHRVEHRRELQPRMRREPPGDAQDGLRIRIAQPHGEQPYRRAYVERPIAPAGLHRAPSIS